MSRSASMRVVFQSSALAALVACSVQGDPADPIVTRAVRHMEVASTVVGDDLDGAAVDYVRSFDDPLDLGLSTDDDYQVTGLDESDGLRHLRLQQVHAGVPVIGSELVVHADDTTFLGFNGTVTSHLDRFDVAAALDDADALAAAHRDHGGSQYSDERSMLAILPGLGGSGATLVWRVAFTSPATGALEAGIWTYYVDAQAGTLIRKFNNLHTMDQGSGAGGNAKKSRTWSHELDLEPDGGEFKMDTDDLKTVNLADGEKVFKGPLDAMPDASANDAHGFAEVTLDMMRTWMGRDSLDDNGFKIVSRVHDTSNCPGAPRNACWNGSVMTYGDGASDRYAYSGALDCVAHELNHGFTTFHSNLSYENQSGGLNESFSDVAGTVAEFYREGDSGDFLILEDVTKGVEASRSMCDPAKFGQIDDAGDYADGQDPHNASGPPNRAFCLAVARYKAAGAGSSTTTAVRELGHIWYTANAAYWTSGTTYEQACRGTIDAARALGHSNEVVEALADSWADIGVECNSEQFVCNNDDSCDVGDGETCASCPDDCGSCSESCSFWKKAKCKIGIGDCSRCDAPKGCGDGVCDGDENDENCGQDCGCAALGCEDLAPYGCWCDSACEDFGDCCDDRGDVCD